MPIADDELKHIATRYGIEKDTRDQGPEARLAARQEQSRPIIGEFETWLPAHRARASAKSPLGDAIKYTAKYRDGLTLFLADGHIERVSNGLKCTIRPIALNRKNAIFAGHDAGAQNWAMLASLAETCELNAVDPHAWLTSPLTATVNAHKQSQIDQLLPRSYTQIL